jgi:very-short-patch-repair endonuclease
MTKNRGISPINAFRRATAKRLRQHETEAERRLWRALRERLPLEGSHFRRQVPIGPYVADIACMAARLVIEVDGSQHAEAAAIGHDAQRTAWLESQGYRVLRFWNSEVFGNIDGVIDTIYATIHGSLSAEAQTLKHARRRDEGPDSTPPRSARLRAPIDPPPPGEGEDASPDRAESLP